MVALYRDVVETVTFVIGSEFPKAEQVTVDAGKCQALATHMNAEIERIIANSKSYVLSATCLPRPRARGRLTDGGASRSTRPVSHVRFEDSPDARPRQPDKLDS